MTAVRPDPPCSRPAPPTSRPVCGPCPGIALDLGSARTRAWAQGRGIILDTPTVTDPRDDASRPVQRGAIVDPEGTALMLERLLAGRIPRSTRPLIVLTTPVLGGVAYRKAARTALDVLRPHTVLTIPRATAVALGAGEDTTRPLLIVDIGAHLTEIFLLTDGAVADAHSIALGTDDLDHVTTHHDITEAVTGTVRDMLTSDRTSQTLDALGNGVLLAGGGALRPEFTPQLAEELRTPVRPVPGPHQAALRGAAKTLESAHRHPSVAPVPAVPPDRPAVLRHPGRRRRE
ncbi:MULTISPECIES: rod shape-determining protein [Streptomyces]|uniref:rod shape-determining protein n=1 Tax=Streptomyces TaxID=1883 RepID=UPI002248FECC|nr:rod shape-determining protein [Streptomyces sp. JHD 1]MCX2971426.1 rod shape-determining protein [Streptomyces sp. JHD 1]